MRFDDCRPEVKAFAVLMEQKLRENDHKGGWEDCTFGYLARRLGQERAEMANAVRDNRASNTAASVERVGREAADVANFAMMIADRCGALR